MNEDGVEILDTVCVEALHQHAFGRFDQRQVLSRWLRLEPAAEKDPGEQWLDVLVEVLDEMLVLALVMHVRFVV